MTPKDTRKGERCVDYGGMTRDGEPCTIVVKGGPCAAHTPEALAKIEETKGRFLALYESGKYTVHYAARELGLNRVTVWRWRQLDEAFDAAVLTAQALGDQIRLDAVEGKYYESLVDGTASPAERIFYLKNRAPNRWRDSQHIDHGGGVSLSGVLRVVPVAESDEEWEAAAQAQQADLVASKARLSLSPPDGATPTPDAA